jgi:transposase InsO family protein
MALRVKTMSEMRLEVLLEAARSPETVAEVCRRHGISRKTFYVYLGRFRAQGLQGLEPRSRQPVRQPLRMAEDLEAQICVMRKEHPKWGARRIRAELARGGIRPPAVSTIHRALVRNNLVALQPSRPRPARQRFERSSPNELWQIDATRLVLADGAEVWVMDLLDDHARFLLAARVASGPTGEAAWAAFEWAVARYGLPAQVLSDNGTCFTGRLIGGAEVAFERRLRSLGVALIHSRPYHPQTLGKLERFHRTMKEWLADHPKAATSAELQDQLDTFRHHYNDERPHQGIDDVTPLERYEAGPAAELNLPVVPPLAAVPSGAIVRKVSACGTLAYRGWQFQVGSAWNGTHLRVAEIDGIVHLYYGEQLVRAVAPDPDTRYYPIGRQRHGAVQRRNPTST